MMMAGQMDDGRCWSRGAWGGGGGGGGGGMALMLGRVLDRGAGGWLQGGERLNILLTRS